VNAGEVRALLARHGLRPRRDLGQNFLVSESLAARMAEQAGVGPEDAVIEIGAGLGVLTRALAARARQVVALEVDAGLVRALRAEGALPAHVELVHADALDVDLAALAAALRPPVRVVANLPYAVSSPLLRSLLAARQALVDWTVLVQREVAARIAAAPGGRDYGSLAVLHALCVRSQRVGQLRPGCFHPAPKVISTALRLTPRADSPLVCSSDRDELVSVERVARAAFATRRKLLLNCLRASDVVPPDAKLEELLAELEIDPRARAESLAPERFLALSRALARPGA
jgi:16S rRNA (adenine1518-N6/adenine1519-N6)-dimethyltransferase